jgi:hypothetical protein
MNAITEQKMEQAVSTEVEVPDGIIGFGTSQGFQMMQRVAKALSMSTLVPKQYQQNIPNCIVALNMANRIGADPLMVMQNLYVVHGNPSWSSQFLIATFNSCGRFSSIRYQWVGTKGNDDWGCYASAVELSSGEVLQGAVVTMELAKKEGWVDKSGSKWKTMPQQMLMYRSAAWFVRAYAPELAMGLHTVEESTDVEDAPKVATFKKNPSALADMRANNPQDA